jgi:ATP-dependent DNA ligase
MTEEAASPRALDEIAPERRAWRPQAFGSRRAREVPDPLIEPGWNGIRILVHVAGEIVAAVDEDGDELEIPPNLIVAITDAARSDELVLDGYLSAQPGRSTEGMVVGRVESPRASDVVRQMFIGTRRSDRAVAPHAVDIRPGDILAFVAIDILSIDGQTLLDVPLLERKRQLEGAFEEGELVRRGLFVRPPIERWLMSWRAMGFAYAMYKAANGRYTPGAANDGWAVWRIPAR